MIWSCLGISLCGPIRMLGWRAPQGDPDDGESVVVLRGGKMKVVICLILRSLGITSHLTALGFNPYLHWLSDGVHSLMAGDLDGLPAGYLLLVLHRRYGGSLGAQRVIATICMWPHRTSLLSNTYKVTLTNSGSKLSTPVIYCALSWICKPEWML